MISGRPISFIQDLYQPLYLPRPVVAPDVVASPYPQTHAGSLEGADKAAQLAALKEDLGSQPTDGGQLQSAQPGDQVGGQGFGSGGHDSSLGA